MELGTYTFADVIPERGESLPEASSRRMAQLLEEAEQADRSGLDVFGLGEHHRADYVVSAPAVALSAIAARTTNLRLTSAVTVLSSDDPVRVFQEFATLDLISGGRAEIMAGRGSFTESFPLFGLSLEDYDELFDEKLRLLDRLRKEETITWAGDHRAPLQAQPVYPRPVQDPLPLWVAVGGNPGSVVRAAQMGLPLAIAIIGGQPVRFAPLAHGFRKIAAESGHDPAQLGVSVNAHGLVADTDEEAARIWLGPYRAMIDKIGRERGWTPLTREQYEAALSPDGHLLVGSPETVAKKILLHHEAFGHSRFLMQTSLGNMDHDAVLRSIELFGTEVAPRVRAAVADRVGAGSAATVG